VKDALFYFICTKKVGIGVRTRFWEDFWIRSDPFSKIYPRLINLTSSSNVSVASLFEKV
jgi:hypothetical protein